MLFIAEASFLRYKKKENTIVKNSTIWNCYNIGNFYGFHGASKANIKNLASGNINVSIGGGELGQGFYLSNYFYAAKEWARAKHNSGSVLAVYTTRRKIVSRLGFARIDLQSAYNLRRYIRKTAQTRTYIIGNDVIKSPIVGNNKLNDVTQYKFESSDAEIYLNSRNTNKDIT